MRITQNMQIKRTLLDQNRNQMRMDQLYNDMSSSTTLHRPSDDPIRVARAIRLETELNTGDTYKNSLNNSNSWVSKTDVTLRNLNELIKRVRDLTVQAADGTKTAEDKQKIMAEIKQLKESAIQMGNEDYMGRTIFSGYKTDEIFVRPDGTYNKNLDLAGIQYENMDYKIGVRQKTTVNITGVDVFGHENYGTKVDAKDVIPFGDDETSLLGGLVNITLKKYKKMDSNLPDYEHDYVLTEDSGKKIELENISFYGDIKKDDVNTIVNRLNDSLREKINAEYPTNKEKQIELKNSVQFVNDGGKIALVTDNDYSCTVTASEVTPDILEITGSESKKIERNNHIFKASKIDPQPYDGGGRSADVNYNFNLKLTEHDINLEDGKLVIDTTNKKKETDLGDISLVGKYRGNDNDQVYSNIARDLQIIINDRLYAKNKDLVGKVNVVVDNDGPKIVVDRNLSCELKEDSNNFTSDDTRATVSLKNGKTEENVEFPIPPKTTTKTKDIIPNQDPTLNKDKDKVITLDFSNSFANSPTNSVMVDAEFGFDILKYPKYLSNDGGDILIVNPDLAATPGTISYKKGDIMTGATSREYSFDHIELVKSYPRKDASDDTKRKIMNMIRDDIQSQIDKISSLPENRGSENLYRVEVDDPDITKVNIIIDKDCGCRAKNNNNTKITNTKFSTIGSLGGTDKVEKNVEDIKYSSDIKISIPTPLPSPKPTTPPLPPEDYDFHFTMNMDLDITRFRKDKNGNLTDNEEMTQNVPNIKINKTYKRFDENGNKLSNEKLQELAAKDIKAEIEKRVAELNPKIDPGSIVVDIPASSTTPNLEITIHTIGDFKVNLKNNNDPEVLGYKKGKDFIPSAKEEKQPTREFMPFFEMMDRITDFMDKGDSVGLDRMLKVVDQHLDNNLKLQGISGAKINMYSIMKDRNETVSLNYKELLSKTRDTDYNEAIMLAIQAQKVYAASLSVTAKIIQPSLVDFLR